MKMHGLLLFLLSLVLSALLLSSCASVNTTLYQQLGGEQGVAAIVDNFIVEIEYSETISPYFEDSDIERFREKMIEHICQLSNGPCQYTGDSMVDVHTGMNIPERDFNRVVDLLINAMDKAGVAHPVQNRLLKTMAPLRKEMLYL
jgi:hemoglobin